MRTDLEDCSTLTVMCLEKIGEVWCGVILDGQWHVVSCGFSNEGKADVTNSILNSVPDDTGIIESNADKYGSSILHNISLIYEGKDPEFTPEFAWERLPPFFRRALRVTFIIPKGKVSTYQGVAEGAGEPKAARAAGNAEASNPFAPFVPCHRVISSSLSLGGYGGSLDVKKAILIREGVVFSGEHVRKECVWKPS
ncbi:MGMT family protein [Candidatus Bathyarchaeota archaeon]|nr:MGMT family protein [Candidatus Bathyarchaeota archaeon]